VIDLAHPAKFWLPPKPAIIRNAADIKKPDLGLLPGLVPVPSSPGPSMSLIGTQSDTVARTTYTFSVDIGNAVNNRVIVIEVSTAIGSGTVTSVTGTIAGVTFSRLIDQTVSVSYGAIIAAICPASAGAGLQTVSINGGASNLSYMAIASYRCLNIKSLMPTATLINSADPSTGTIDVAARGLLFAHARCGNSTPTYSWVGINEDYDYTVGATNRTTSGGGYQAGVAETGRTVTATRSIGGGNNHNLVAASIR
jgi:hypothetical protein